MQRRALLKLGIATSVVLALAGGGVAMFRPAWREGRLTSAGRMVFRAVALAVLDGTLPADVATREVALAAHLERLEATLRGLPNHTQGEVADLIALLAMPPGRVALAGLADSWDQASIADLQAALQSMRLSSLALRQQAYHALRDLTHAAYFSDASTWALLDYPGPRDI